jgi:hypothetical protein
MVTLAALHSGVLARRRNARMGLARVTSARRSKFRRLMERLAYQVIRLSQKTPFRGEVSYGVIGADAAGQRKSFPQGNQEL